MAKTGAELLESGERFAVTMWEYSWLVQRCGRQNEYEDWDKVLDELVERGYNCIRIDAYPHLIAAGPDGEVQEEFTMLPIDEHFMWGNHEEVTVNPRQGVVEFMQKAKERDLYIGLSSWYNDDTTHRKLTIRSPEDYVRIWTETLDLLAAAGLLDIVVWVDVCNEFPLPMWTPGTFQDIFGGVGSSGDDALQVGMLQSDWKQDSVRRFEAYLTESITGIREKYPGLKYTFSFCGLGSDNIVRADVSALDLAEPHIWTTDDPVWLQESGMTACQAGDYQEGLRTYVEKVMKVYPSWKERCQEILDGRMDFWLSWAKDNDLPLVTTEGWTAVLYEDISPNGEAGEWEWFKDIAEMGVRLAVEKGWQGICTSNFCEPHFEGMWKDVAWHRRMTDLILK